MGSCEEEYGMDSLSERFEVLGLLCKYVCSFDHQSSHAVADKYQRSLVLIAVSRWSSCRKGLSRNSSKSNEAMTCESSSQYVHSNAEE